MINKAFVEPSAKSYNLLIKQKWFLIKQISTEAATIILNNGQNEMYDYAEKNS